MSVNQILKGVLVEVVLRGARSGNLYAKESQPTIRFTRLMNSQLLQISIFG